MARSTSFEVSDGKLNLTLTQAEEGGYVVTSRMHPDLITEAESIPEAFEMARDALKALAASRRKLQRQFAQLERASA